MSADLKCVVTASGLTKIELAALYGVSRQTIHYWVSTAPPRAGSLLARQAETITRALLNAIERGILPLTASTHEIRQRKVGIMARQLQSLKLAPGK